MVAKSFTEVLALKTNMHGTYALISLEHVGNQCEAALKLIGGPQLKKICKSSYWSHFSGIVLVGNIYYPVKISIQKCFLSGV